MNVPKKPREGWKYRDKNESLIACQLETKRDEKAHRKVEPIDDSSIVVYFFLSYTRIVTIFMGYTPTCIVYGIMRVIETPSCIETEELCRRSFILIIQRVSMERRILARDVKSKLTRSKTTILGNDVNSTIRTLTNFVDYKSSFSRE